MASEKVEDKDKRKTGEVPVFFGAASPESGRGLQRRLRSFRHRDLRPLMRSPRVWAIAGGFVLIALAAGAAAVLLHRSSSELPTHVAGYSKFTGAGSVSNQAYSYANAGDYASAQNLLADQLAQTSKSEDRAQLYIVQATVAINAKKYGEAKRYAAQAEQIRPTDESAGLLGDAAMAQKDTAAAKRYYQTAIDRLKKGTPGYPGLYNQYSVKLKAAG